MKTPGLYFQTVTPERPRTLPRMDVPAFVGFATSGPLHTPVPVEDVARFVDIFGEPLDLARDEATGRMDTTYLHSAVVSFFRNGGERCWVVRVAKSADRARAVVPGLVDANGHAATAPARCQGTRFDTLRLGTVARREVLPDARLSVAQTSASLTWTSTPGRRIPDADALRTGDVMQVDFAGGRRILFEVDQVMIGEASNVGERTVSAREILAFSTAIRHPLDAAADPVSVSVFGDADPNTPSVEGSLTKGADGLYELETTTSLEDVLEDREERELAAQIEEPSGAHVMLEVTEVLDENDFRYRTRLRAILHPVTVQRAEPRTRDDSPDNAPTVSAFLVVFIDGDGTMGEADVQVRRELHFEMPDEGVEHAGRVVHVILSDGTTSSVAWMQLGRASVPDENNETVEVEVVEALWTIDREALLLQNEPAASVQKLSFDLLVFENREIRYRLERLGLSGAHPRAWTSIPTDAEVFPHPSSGPRAEVPEPGMVASDAFAPRFPFAGPAPSLFVPLGMSDRPEAERSRPVLLDARTDLEREGLATFRVAVFRDSRLEGTQTRRLKAKADNLVYIQQERATGFHALWDVPEVSLIALPDAAHREWIEGAAERPDPMRAPVLQSPTKSEGPPYQIDVSWQPPANASESYDPAQAPGLEFDLQESRVSTFETAQTLHRGARPRMTRYVRSDGPQRLLYRVRVRRTEDGPWSGWSNVVTAEAPPPDIDTCRRPLAAPSLNGPIWPDRTAYVSGTYNRIEWTTVGVIDPSADAESDALDAESGDSSEDSSVTYDVQVGDDPQFVSARSVPDDAQQKESSALWFATLPERGPAVQYVRVRARQGERVSPWSRTVVVTRELKRPRRLISASHYDAAIPAAAKAPSDDRRAAFIELQRDLLRFCAARGDIEAVLNLPSHDGPPESARHIARLRSTDARLDSTAETVFRPDELRTLSRGAVFGPWGLMQGRRDQILLAPLDGAVCGQLASVAIDDGAWRSAANRALDGVQALSPSFSEQEVASLQATAVNAFRRRPSGPTCLSADTLALDDPLRPLTTRRLLTLLRRVVAREGDSLVFESNTPLLHRRVADRYDELLRRLFRRGAFAGATPAEAYRIVTGPSVNPPDAIERGRLIVELRVAPARALRFLTIRLVQRSGEAVAVT